MEGLALWGENVDLSSPAFNNSLPCWNIFLLNFNQKHKKNRLFIIGKANRVVSFLYLAKLLSASAARLPDPKPAKLINASPSHSKAHNCRTERHRVPEDRLNRVSSFSLGQGITFNMKISVGKFDKCCWTFKFLFGCVWCSLWGLKWSIWIFRTEKTKQVDHPCGLHGLTLQVLCLFIWWGAWHPTTTACVYIEFRFQSKCSASPKMSCLFARNTSRSNP